MMRQTRQRPLSLFQLALPLVVVLSAWTTTTLLTTTTTHAFTTTTTLSASSSRCSQVRSLLSSSSSSLSSSSPSSSSVVVVVSPPGGVGEVAAVKAASLGSQVKWFVVSSNTEEKQLPQKQQQVSLSSLILDQIASAGGKVELAGASASSLLLPMDDPNSALPAVSAWCSSASSTSTSTNAPTTAILCTLDGIDAALEAAKASSSSLRSSYQRDDDMEAIKVEWRNALKVATRQAAASVAGTVRRGGGGGARKIAIVSALEEEQEQEDGGSSDGDKERGRGGVVELVGSLLGGGKRPFIPDTLTSALSSSSSEDGEDAVIRLRHGVLFGVPESSPSFSALLGGPRKLPELCEEYVMRAVRVDPTRSIAGNLMMGSTTRTSRHTVGEAAALLALGLVDIGTMVSTDTAKQDYSFSLDVCVSSQRGSDAVSLEVWNQEFRRAILASKTSASSAEAAKQQQLLFSTEFSAVPDIPRLADWLATKWAPAILRTYDIAAIRVGARPVYATRVDSDKVEIVWQQLVDFASSNVGKMILQVNDNGLIATRGPGDASKGFGQVSRKPLAGEDVLVRRLAEAASQAIEKGLAKKPLPAAKPPKEEKRLVAGASMAAPVVTSIRDSGTVVAAATATATRAAAAVVEVAEPTTSTTITATTKKKKKTTTTTIATPPPTTTAEPASTTASSDQGPRQAGARRSTERKRGKRRIENNNSNNDDE